MKHSKNLCLVNNSMETKVCIKCQIEYPISEFKAEYRKKVNKTYAKNICRKCHNIYHRTWAVNFRKTKAGSPEYAEYVRKRRIQCKKTTANRRRRIISHYSGGSMRCSWCHEDDYMVLTIDHVNNDGAADRKSGSGSGIKLYLKLIKNGFPKGFDILCMNCNLAKKLNGGVSPEHRRLGHSLESLAVPCI